MAFCEVAAGLFALDGGLGFLSFGGVGGAPRFCCPCIARRVSVYGSSDAHSLAYGDRRRFMHFFI